MGHRKANTISST